MTDLIQILYVDDNPHDRDLVRDALEKEAGNFQVTEAASRTEFEKLLAARTYDLVLSDFNILGFEGLQVIEAVHAVQPGVPVLIVTGTGNEEVAVEAMKRGACDYVIKTPRHIRRLPRTIQAELDKRHAAEISHRLREERDRLFDFSIDLLCVMGFDEFFKQLNPAWSKALGWTNEELSASPYIEFVHPEDRNATAHAVYQLSQHQQPQSFDCRFRCRDSTYKFLSWNAYPLKEEQLIFVVARDNTARQLAEERVERQLQRLAALRQIDLAITAAFDLRIVLNVLVEQAATQLHVDLADIFLFNPQTRALEYAVGYGFYANLLPRNRLHIGESYAGRAILERRIIYVPNLAAPPADSTGNSWPVNDPSLVAYYGVPLIAKGEIKGALEIYHRSPLNSDSEWLDFLESLAGQAAIAIDNAQLFDGLQRSNIDLMLAYDATIEGWSRALDLRDKETEGHSQRVTNLTLELAQASGLFSSEDLNHIRWGALLHDIGKMGIPDYILLKPGPLTDDEWAIMHRHPTYAYQLISPIAYLKPALDIPYCHHEKWDGTGYPRGLKGDQIPLAARLFAVVDVWDALRSDRPYRTAWPEEKVRAHLKSLSGTHFDPHAVDAFLGLDQAVFSSLGPPTG